MSELKDYIVASIKKDLDALKSKGWVTQQSYDTIVAELTKVYLFLYFIYTIVVVLLFWISIELNGYFN